MMRTLLLTGLFTISLIFLGCSGQTKKENPPLNIKDEEQIFNSVEEYQNKATQTIFTKEAIDTTSNENLVENIFESLYAIHVAPNPQEYETVLTWNKSRQAIYVVHMFKGEVNNGGYNQYYANISGEFYKLLPEALKRIGANKFAEQAQQANNTYEKENKQITQHQDGTVKGFSESYKNSPLEKYTDAFFDLYETENLEQLMIDYIRKHKTDFID